MNGGTTMKKELLILQRVFGRPWAKAPAKALCSRGEMWYLVVPLTVTPSLPKPRPSLATEVLMMIGSEKSMSLKFDYFHQI